MAAATGRGTIVASIHQAGIPLLRVSKHCSPGDLYGCRGFNLLGSVLFKQAAQAGFLTD